MFELAIAQAVFDRFSAASEGRLAKVRARVVSARAVPPYEGARVGERVLKRPGDAPADELQRISRSRNVLAAVLEAAIAAVYLEHGFEAMEPALVEASRSASSTRARATSTTRRAPGGARAIGRMSTTRCSRSRARHTTASSCARRMSPASSSASARVDEEGCRARSRAPGPRGARRRARPDLNGASARVRLDGENPVPVHLRTLTPRCGEPAFPASVRPSGESRLGAPALASHTRLQVVPRHARDRARARCCRHRRPERLGQVEHRRRDRLGGRVADAVRAARREARRRPVRRRRRSQAGRALRGRARLRQRGRRVARSRLLRGLDRATAHARRRGAVPREPRRRAAHRPRRDPLRRRARLGDALDRRPGQGRAGAGVEAGGSARIRRGGGWTREVQAPPASRRAEARARRTAGRARSRRRG